MTVFLSDINAWYEDRMYHTYSLEYYDQSDFFNFGYWEENTQTQKEACENLLDRLLDFVPDKSGNILDVACGKGATTRHLLRYYRPDQVSAVDVSLKQLATSSQNAPGARFSMMSAPRLAFHDESFDTVMCVEAVFHFDTRQDFLNEAYRVLRPGGKLILTDILTSRLGDKARHIRTERNYVPNLDAYRRGYARAGFADVEIIDTTLQSWTRFYRKMLYWHWTDILLRHGDVRTFLSFVPQIFLANAAMKNYLLVAATKA